MSDETILRETGYPERDCDIPEEVLVCEFIDALRKRWEKLEVGIDTAYTFEGYLGQQLMFARETIKAMRDNNAMEAER